MIHKQIYFLLFILLIGSVSFLVAQEKTVTSPSQEIDQALLKSAAIESFKSIPDDVFLRRTYLSIGNRIPTYEESNDFNADTSPTKRNKLIEKLINSVDYNEAMYPFWADMLRLQSKIKGVYGDKYRKWVKKSIAENKPYDKMVFDLINASGNLSENGAIGYYLRDEGNVLEVASTSSQIFLGTQIGCAQCHNHAFEDWTQKQFYEFTAYIGKVTIKDAEPKKGLKKEFKDEGLSQIEKDVMKKIVENAAFEVKDNDKRELKFPADYKYQNAKPNEVVKPHVFFGEQPQMQDKQQKREAFAHWLTSKENPYFTKIIVNRLWKKVMGVGLFEPIDDYNSTTKVSNPEVLAILEKSMQDANFDMKKFLSIIYNTQFYQIPSTVDDTQKNESKIPERPLTRMKAEQVWNSLLTLTRKDINEYFATETPTEMEDLIVSIQKEGFTEEIKAKLIAKAKTIAEAQQEKNNDGTKKNKKKKPTDSKGKEIAKDDVMNKDEMNDDEMEKPKLTKAESKKALEERAEVAGKARIGLKENLAGRASEIVSPAPEQHFLNFFGQSDRLIIEEGNLDPNLPQVLALLNSQLTTQFILRNSYIKRQVNLQKANVEKINYLYQVILTRKPSASESQTAVGYLVKNEKTGIEDMIWVLVNSREFIFIQ